MNKKEMLDKKLTIFRKMLEAKEDPIKVLIEEQEKSKEILNPNFEDRSSNDNKNMK